VKYNLSVTFCSVPVGHCVYSLVKLVKFLSLCYRFLCFRCIRIIIRGVARNLFWEGTNFDQSALSHNDNGFF